MRKLRHHVGFLIFNILKINGLNQFRDDRIYSMEILFTVIGFESPENIEKV